MGACCLCACVFRIVLGLLNTVIILVGLAISALGGILLGLASNTTLNLILQGILFSVLSTLNIVSKTTLDNIGETTTSPYMLHQAGIALVISGLIIAAIGVVGYFGLILNIILKIYALLVIILVIVESIVVGVFFSGAVNSQVRTVINTTILNDYISIYDAGFSSLIFNVIMIEFDCCGMDNYEDFYYTKHPYPMDDTIKTSDGNFHNVTFVTPLPCCKHNGSYVNLKFVNDYCAVTPRDNTSNWNTGCWNEVFSAMTQPAVIVIVSLIIVVQAVIGLMAGIIIRESSSGPVGSS